MKIGYILLLLLLIVLYFCTQNKTKEHYGNMCTIDKVYYYTNVLSNDDYIKIHNECVALKNDLLRMELEDTEHAKRRILNVRKDSQLYDIFYGKQFIDFLNNKLHMKLKPSKLLPIDYRIYELGGRMNWHRDVIISDNNKCPQIEIVFTLDNTSDSHTIWKEDNTDKIHEIRTESNSILITQGNSVYHKVLPITKGSRSIIKIAYEVI